MSTGFLFVAPDPILDRGKAMMVCAELAAREARCRKDAQRAWPTAEAILVHLGRSLIDLGEFDRSDLLRRLLGDWAARVGRPRLAVVGGRNGVARAMVEAPAEWVAGLAPLALLHRTDRRAAQFDVAQMAQLFNCPSDQAEALEVFSIFLRRALSGESRDTVLQPLAWAGDARVAAVCDGQSLPIDDPRDLVAAVGQARSLALADIALPIAFEALSGVQASRPAFILTAMLIAAFDGSLRRPDVGAQAQGAVCASSPTALLELIARRLLQRQNQRHVQSASRQPSEPA
ncbi:hypothetical protein HNP47_002097 [Brevundimonas vesicularis]|uniref:Uncharacterized protein n=1 Tax=Brevundimonas vesicularis TaxID=41276 RepID=A0A7W9L669_BREVE|nr:hypothetical protein [Brevundimonas vesicularis]MBB5772093.1 hypothetical protein [Brevundimonas vesicularis]